MKDFKSITAGLYFAIAVFGLMIGSAHSTPIVTPAGLAVGAQYRLAFVTSTTRDATSTNIADYNMFVTNLANSQSALNALGINWMAIASTAADNARDNTNTNPAGGAGVPIYLLNGTKLADNNNDFWDGTLDTPLKVTEAGTFLLEPDPLVWTGSNSDGQGDGFSSVLGGTSPTGIIGGRALVIDSSWIRSFYRPKTASLHLYGLSGVLTVSTIPEPGTLALFGLGLAGLGYARRKRTI